jgi:putative transcriptional regulator
MSSFGEDLIAALTEAAGHAEGVGQVARVHTVEVPDVRAIREEMGMSQQAFATASAYLSVIVHLPEAAREALQAN